MRGERRKGPAWWEVGRHCSWPRTPGVRLGVGGGRPGAEGGSAPVATGVWPGGGAVREGGTGLVVALGGMKGPAGREVG